MIRKMARNSQKLAASN